MNAAHFPLNNNNNNHPVDNFTFALTRFYRPNIKSNIHTNSLKMQFFICSVSCTFVFWSVGCKPSNVNFLFKIICSMHMHVLYCDSMIFVWTCASNLTLTSFLIVWYLIHQMHEYRKRKRKNLCWLRYAKANNKLGNKDFLRNIISLLCYCPMFAFSYATLSQVLNTLLCHWITSFWSLILCVTLFRDGKSANVKYLMFERFWNRILHWWEPNKFELRRKQVDALWMLNIFCIWVAYALPVWGRASAAFYHWQI